MPRKTVEKTINNILNLGIKVEYNKELGKNLYLKELEREYDAIFLSFGANNSSKIGVEGENIQGVYGGNELLENNLHPNYNNKKVIVVGGGNVAMDCARTVKRLGAKDVIVVYRRARKQMPAEDKEVEEAIKEGVEFLFQHNIVKIKGIEAVEQVELIKTELIKKEGEEREIPVNIANSNYVVDADYVVSAVGSKVSKITYELGLELNKWGNVIINDNYQTSNPKIFAGGDLAGIKGTVAYASNSGKEASNGILKYFLN